MSSSLLSGPVPDEIIQSLGLVQLRRAEVDPPGRIRLAVPRFQCNVDLDEALIADRSTSAADVLLKVLDGARRELFGKTVEHVAKHDRSPLDRTEQIERMAQALIDAIETVGFVPMNIAHAAADLQQILRAKPGAASWSRNGYGADHA